MKLFNKKDDSWFLSLELGPTKLVVVRLSDAGFSFQLMQVSVSVDCTVYSYCTVYELL